jgi:hypothetical protein
MISMVLRMKLERHTADRTHLAPWEPCPIPCETCSSLDAPRHEAQHTVVLDGQLVAKIRAWSQNLTNSKPWV